MCLYLRELYLIEVIISAMYSRLWRQMMLSTAICITGMSTLSCLRKWQDGYEVELCDWPPACNVTRITNTSFADVPIWITSLTIRAHIQIIQPGVFSVFHSLTKLELHDNCIKCISANTFRDLVQLNYLFLSYNQLG